ncbi:MAG: hypothetical protein GX128_06900 [Bacteroidales bacterium]|jgi:hypothetical protein|nr:hypothetical protein [Bacteroidales bacterium]
MAQKLSKSRRKKVKYKSLSFKLSNKEYNRIARYCKKHKLTPNKLIKKSLRTYVSHIGPIIDQEELPVSENQLTIFDFGA